MEKKERSIVITVPEGLYDKIKEAGSDFGLTAPAFVKMLVSKTLGISDILSDLKSDEVVVLGDDDQALSKRGRIAKPRRAR